MVEPLHIELIMDLEEELNVFLPLDDFSDVQTVGELIDLLIDVQRDG